MTLQEFYDNNGDYNDVTDRLLKEERILKFLRRLPEDNSIQELTVAVETNDYETAFRCTHNLKGLCLNLGLTTLAKCSSVVCEEFRDNKPTEDYLKKVNDLKELFEKVVNEINCID